MLEEATASETVALLARALVALAARSRAGLDGEARAPEAANLELVAWAGEAGAEDSADEVAC